MSTKLEAMVGYLAGREVEPKLLEELADPASEASRFLEATRVRSKALMAEPEPAPRPPRSGRGGMIALALLAIAALVAFAATLRVVDRRFRLLEATFEARTTEAKADARRIEATLDRLAGPQVEPDWAGALEASLTQVEAGLERSEARSKADPAVAEAREQLAAIRREVSASERAAVQRAEELHAAIRDEVRVLKLLLNRFDPPTNPTPDPRRPKP